MLTFPRVGQGGATALFVASQSGHVPCVRELLQAGAGVRLRMKVCRGGGKGCFVYRPAARDPLCRWGRNASNLPRPAGRGWCGVGCTHSWAAFLQRDVEHGTAVRRQIALFLLHQLIFSGNEPK